MITGRERDMYKKIMLPVDLAHADKLERALDVAGDLASHYGAELVYVGVTGNTPSSIAHTPHEYGEKLRAFAEREGGRHGHAASAHAVVSHDPAAELDDALIAASHEVGADLIVMATHVPNVADMLIPAHGGTLARHTDLSVFLVRSA